jgi:hypothetical protein
LYIFFRGKFRGISWKNDFLKLFLQKFFSPKFSPEKMYEKSAPDKKRKKKNLFGEFVQLFVPFRRQEDGEGDVLLQDGRPLVLHVLHQGVDLRSISGLPDFSAYIIPKRGKKNKRPQNYHKFTKWQ